MHRKGIFLLATLLLSVFQFIGQEVYLVSEENTIMRFDWEDYSVTPLFDIDIFEVGYLTDLAYAPNGNLYGISGANYILEIDVVNETYTIVYEITNGGIYPGMVANANNQLLLNRFLFEDLFQYDLINGTFESIQNGVSTPGDFSFYKGNLIYPSNQNIGVKAYDGTNIRNVGCTAGQIFTFFNVFTDCENNQIFGVDEQNNLYSYVLETQEFELLTQLDYPATIFGGCSTTEYLASDCTVAFLEAVDCTLSVSDKNRQSVIISPNPSQGLVTVDVEHSEWVKTMTVYDRLGSQLEQIDGYEPILDLSALPRGMYFLEIQSNKGMDRVIKKMIKQ